MSRRAGFAIAVVAASLAIGAAASARVPSEPTRIAANVRTDFASIVLEGALVAWVGVAASGDDSEIFLADAAQPIVESIGLCPLTNPCQLTDDADDEVNLLASGAWIVWQRSALPPAATSIWFSDGVQIATVPGSAESNTVYYRDPVSLSGSRVVWRGADDAGSTGTFLADLARPLANGAASLCPLTNPCKIASASAPSSYDTAPVIDAARVVWSARPAAGEDTEIHLFDATQPADALLLACPASNPCLFTNNDRADAAPLVSGSLIAWAQCEDANCGSDPPDRLVFTDGSPPVELIGEYTGEPRSIEGSRIAWNPGLSPVLILDTAEPIDVAPLTYPRDCPLSNPCYLDATGGVQMAGPWLLSSNATDIANEPIDLRLFDLRRPLDPRPFGACPSTNPCVLRENVEYRSALSSEAVAWLECPPDAEGCAYPYAGNFDLYIVPEPDGVALAIAAIAATIALGRRRRARCCNRV